ncbi:MAG TPA: hypothetical protein VHZ03_40105 [Trebonia sp.]|jgi:hypothetical protein|nr:hypothetical protein [Trebonia sp.]
MSDDRERRLLALIKRQDRVVSRQQALAGGISRHAVAHRIRPGGPWHAMLPGVYLTVTGTPTQVQREMAAVLYAGPRSVITGGAALRNHRLPTPQAQVIDLLVPTSVQRRNVSFVRLHRTSRMPTRVFGPQHRAYALPARAAADAALWLSDLREARAVIAGAVQSRSCWASEIVAELDAGPIRGSALLRKIVAEVSDGVRSAPEADLRDLIKRARLPLPMFNPRLYLANGTFLGCPDAWWPEAGLAIEIDSRRWHLNPRDWEHTMDRHARFGEHAIVTLHFSPHKLRAEPGLVITTIRNAYKAGIARPLLPIAALSASPEAAVVVMEGRL